jgi:uncharacterized protein YndB with AHSA1/START domain
MTEPLRFPIEVACPVAHAFSVWPSGIATWWPADHTVTGERGLSVVLEPRVAGRMFERTAGGAEQDWGEITVGEPPSRLEYRWFLRSDRADATDVAIRYGPDGDDATRVEITHSGWEWLGTRGGAWRERNPQGWSTLPPHHTAAPHRRTTPPHYTAALHRRTKPPR